MAVRVTDFVLVSCSVNVNKTLAGVGIVRFYTIEPENARQDKILGRWKWVVGLERDAARENCACRRALALPAQRPDLYIELARL